MDLASNAANESPRPVRRSSRIDCTVPMTVMGVDAWRGPYTESVSTVNVSAHGCKYESAHQVLNDSLVILEFKKDEKTARSARGRVKYVKRPSGPGRPFETAIELENPGNVWGVDSPPTDWSAFSLPKQVELDTSKPKPFALPRPETPQAAPPARAEGRADQATSPPVPGAVMPISPNTSGVAHVMGGFQQQLEKTLSEAAGIAAQERTRAAFEELRGQMREEARKIVVETIRTTLGTAVETALARLKSTADENAKALHAQWAETMKSELQAACDQVQVRRREMEDVAESLSASTLDKLQTAMETSRRDSVDRIIARLKEQSAPILGNAQNVLAQLSRGTQDLSGVFARSLEESTARIQEAHAQLEKQFDKTVRERLEAAQTEFARATRAASIEALHDLRSLSQKYEAEAKARLESTVSPIIDDNLSSLREKASAISAQVAVELEEHSRSHLELVGGAISELAKGLGKKARE
jgi:PilZ domain